MDISFHFLISAISTDAENGGANHKSESFPHGKIAGCTVGYSILKRAPITTTRGEEGESVKKKKKRTDIQFSGGGRRKLRRGSGESRR
jgi:hypothetical protein